MLINVTQEDINGGCIGDGSNCPVSKAIERAIGKPVHVSFYVGCIQDGSGRTFVNPTGVTDWIINFDNGKPVELFSFELEIPA